MATPTGPECIATRWTAQPAQRIVLGAWYEQGSYLRCEAGSYQLLELPR